MRWCASRNPLKTGLVTARWELDPEDWVENFPLSQSPENGSRHCKLSGSPTRHGSELDRVAIP